MNNFIKKNYKALEINHIFLAEKLKSDAKKTTWFMPETNTKYSVVTDTNEVIPGNPNDNPKETVKAYKYHNDEATVVVGVGNGSLLYEICKAKKKEHIVLLVEPESDIMNYAFKNYDFSKWLKDGSLLMFANTDPNEILGVIAYIDNTKVIQDWILFIEPYTTVKKEIYVKIVGKISAYINHLRCNTGTVMSAGGLIAKNDIENIPYVIRHKGINVFKNKFKNKPAILVATGPSLMKNIHYIKEMQDKAVIIAVGQALRILLAYGIRPDFIGTVDFGEVNMTHFTGLMDSDVPLIALNRTYAPLLKEWRGGKYICATINPGFENTIAGILNDRGSLEQGGSVSHFMFGFAIHCGCNPIIITGQDLALTDGLSHNSNADSAGKVSVENGMIKWTVTDPRSPALAKEVMSMGEAIYVPGYYEEPVLTNIGLASFITAYEEIIQRCCTDITIINSTEGGARIEGTKQMALIDAGKKYCTSTIDKSIIQKEKGLLSNYIEEIKKATKMMEEEIQLLKDIVNQVDLAIITNEKLQEISEQKKINKEEFNHQIMLNKKYSDKAYELSEKNALIKLHIYHASRTIQNRELKVKADTKHLYKHNDDFKTRIIRNKMILEAAKKACNDLLPSYDASLSLLNKYLETNDETLLTSQTQYIPSLQDCEIYFDAGNWARPYLDALKLKSSNDTNKAAYATDIIIRCEKLRDSSIKEAKEKYKDNSKIIKYNELVSEARKIGANKKHEESLKLLEEAIEIYPDKFQARWGKATVLHHMNKSDEAIKVYDFLIEKFPDLNRLKFEKGLVLLNIDVQDGLEYLVKLLCNEPHFQYFWRNIGQLYESSNPGRALVAYEKYIEKYPADFSIKNKIEQLKKVV